MRTLKNYKSKFVKLCLSISFLQVMFSVQAQMVLEYNTSLSDGTSITLPLFGTVDVTVDWGDGNSEAFTSQGNKIHTYEIDGTYTVTISGTLTHFGAINYPDANKLTRIIDFGDIGLTDLSMACYNAINLTEVPLQIPAAVTNISAMFYNAEFFNQDISTWDVSNVTDMSQMFKYASYFNQPIGSWNVSNVTDMSGMFNHVEDFDQDIGNWNVSNVTNMSQMFLCANSFNQPIGNWDVSNVTNMESMFNHSFVFNQHLNNWDVSSVLNMNAMFMEAYFFNGKIENWNVSNVTNMSEMFRTAAHFNQDIGNWDVSNVTNMSGMFRMAIIFNQNIGEWNVGNVTSMSSMFRETDFFNQNIGSWNVSNVSNMSLMFYGAALSVENYDALLIGWAPQSLHSNINFDGGNSNYSCQAVSAHDILTGAPNNWTVSDAGLIDDETPPTITCPPNLTITANNTNQTYTVIGTLLDPLVFDDNCPGSFITNDYNMSSTLNLSVFSLGTTSVVWTVEDATGEQSTCFLYVTVNTMVDVENILSNALLTASPNPSNGYITIDCGENFKSLTSCSLNVVNSLNQTVYSEPVNSQFIILEPEIFTGKGIYFVYLINQKNQHQNILKLVVE